MWMEGRASWLLGRVVKRGGRGGGVGGRFVCGGSKGVG